MGAFNNFNHFLFSSDKGNRVSGFRQRAFLLCVMALLSACAANQNGDGTHANGKFTGIIVADDAKAALVGKEVLDAGGNAFDAAVATAFTMAVTVPSRAGLGSNGMCQIFIPQESENQILTFFDDNVKETYAVPAMPRAMLALHAKGGQWRWEQVIAPAELIAKSGFNAHKPYITDMPEVTEGDVIKSFDLAFTLASLRANRVKSFYVGGGLKIFADAAKEKGINISEKRIRDFIPKWLPPAEKNYGFKTMYFLPDNFGDITIPETYADSESNKDKDGKLSTSSKAAGLAVVDASGTAVACTFSMGQDFDKTKEITGSGVVLSKVTALPRKDMATMMVTDSGKSSFYYVGYMTTENAAEDLFMIATDFVKDEKFPKDIFENRATESDAGFGAIYCEEGLPYHPSSCRFIYNPKMGGYGRSVW